MTALPTAEAREAPGSAGRAAAGRDASDRGSGGRTASARSSSRRPHGSAGYLGEPPAAGPIRTGDLGRLDDEGRLFVVDRREDRIVRGGENVSPAEVEAVLLAQPAIAEAAVVARRDEVLGQVPVAAIVVRPDAADPGDDAILLACRASLAGFKVPAAIVAARCAAADVRRQAPP